MHLGTSLESACLIANCFLLSQEEEQLVMTHREQVEETINILREVCESKMKMVNINHDVSKLGRQWIYSD